MGMKGMDLLMYPLQSNQKNKIYNIIVLAPLIVKQLKITNAFKGSDVCVPSQWNGRKKIQRPRFINFLIFFLGIVGRFYA